MNAKEIVTKTFDKAKFNGYKTDEVDAFLRDVSVEFKKLQNENAELEKKLEVLASKIREYRSDEEALRDALLIAKKQGIAVVNDAKEQAEKINKEAKEKAAKTTKDADDLAAKKKELSEKALAEAKAEAERIVAEAKKKADEIHTVMMQQTEREQIVLQRTRREVSDYTAKILSAYKAHIEYIKSIPADCENEFVINTAKEVEARKPSESAFAKKPEPKKEEVKKPEPAKPEPKKEEVKKPEPKKEEPPKAQPEKKEAPKAQPANEKILETLEVKISTEGIKAETKEEKKVEKKTDSILFNINNEKPDKKSETHKALEFGKKDK